MKLQQTNDFNQNMLVFKFSDEFHRMGSPGPSHPDFSFTKMVFNRWAACAKEQGLGTMRSDKEWDAVEADNYHFDDIVTKNVFCKWFLQNTARIRPSQRPILFWYLDISEYRIRKAIALTALFGHLRQWLIWNMESFDLVQGTVPRVFKRSPKTPVSNSQKNSQLRRLGMSQGSHSNLRGHPRFFPFLSCLLLQPVVRQCPFTQKVGEATLASLVEAIPVQSFQPGEAVV